MKKILFVIVSLVSVSCFAQNTFTGKNKFNDTIVAPNMVQKIIDTTNLKPVTIDASGNLMKMYWPSTGISGITADNGLTASTSTNVQLGGTLNKFTQITTSGFSLISLSSSSNYGLRLLDDGTGLGLNISVNSFPINSTTSVISPVLFQTTDNAGVSSQSSLLQVLNNPSSAVSNGVGAEIEFGAKTSTTSSRISNQLKSKWTDVTDATRTSQFSITGVNSGATNSILSINGDGSTTFYGSQTLPYVSKAVDYTATTSDYAIEVTATGKTITLPTAVGCAGRKYTIELSATGSGTVATTSSQNINGSTTYSLASQYKYVTVMSNGTGWIVIANN